MLKLLNKQKGFTLAEAIVSIFIVGIGLVAVTQIFPFAMRIIGDSQRTAMASNLAIAQVENMQSMNYDDITTGAFEAKHRLSDDSSNYLYPFQRKTDVFYVNSNFTASLTDVGYKKITVTVYWQSALTRNEKSIFISTLSAKY
jgi:prepilin-type N-terminal cleavage/methylation domain-containing protein